MRRRDTKSGTTRHDIRRLRLVPARIIPGGVSANVCAIMAAAEQGAYDAAFGRGRRRNLYPYMKRSDYLAAYNDEIRRGKWRERRWRRESKQWDRWYKRHGMGTLKEAMS